MAEGVFMGSFMQILQLIWEQGFSRQMTIYGYTFSFADIIIWSLFAGLLIFALVRALDSV